MRTGDIMTTKELKSEQKNTDKLRVEFIETLKNETKQVKKSKRKRKTRTHNSFSSGRILGG